MAYKIMDKNEINNEAENTTKVNDRGVTSTDLLCKSEPGNIRDDLIIGFYSKYKGLRYASYVRFKKEDQNWEKILELIGTDNFISCIIRDMLKEQKIIPGNWFDHR